MNKQIQKIFVIAVVVFVSVLAYMPASAASFEPAWGRDGMVVTSVGPAAASGKYILEKGGNAVDAAVATSFTAAVANQFSSGLGGGLFALVFDAASGETAALDAREVSPASGTAEFYKENPQSIRRGPRAVGVPGFVQGLWALHQRYGSMAWKDLLEPAIAMAENGVEVTLWHHKIVSRVEKALADYPETQSIQTIDGKAPPLGARVVQKDLAATLRKIQAGGGQTLAKGEIAKKIEAATGGAVTELDLARYQVKWRKPIAGSYRGLVVLGMPPPSSGGILIQQMFNILSRYNLAEYGKGSSRYIHLLGSTMKLAYADRALYLGDADYYPVPVERLISREHADSQAARIRAEAQPKIDISIDTPPDDSGTTQISIMDRFGNAVALTQTINSVFGSMITVPGTGIVLNNEMDDFSVGPEIPNVWQAVGSIANAVEPGKRPLSSMSPTIVLKDGKPYLVAGSPMGTTIITSVLQALINVIDFDFDAQRAVMAPRFHHQWRPDSLWIEPEFPLDVREKLQALGYTLRERNFMGAVQLIMYDEEQCYYWGGADGRRASAAAGANIGTQRSAEMNERCGLAAAAGQSVVP